MNYCRLVYIYGLYEIGKEDQIRYIGKTNNLKKRLRDHKNDNRITSYKSSWVKSVLSKGGDVGIKPIALVDESKWEEMEIHYISKYRKTNHLVNLTDGGNGNMSYVYNKSLEECKEWIKPNKPEWVISIQTYKTWSKMEDFPDFLPKAPNRVFIDWLNWGDYLGTNFVCTHNKKDIYLSYEEAKKYLKDNFNFQNSKHFRKSKIPNFIPKKPFKIYKQWKGWEDFLDYKFAVVKDRKYLEYDEAKKWIRENLGKISSEEYRKKAKLKQFPDFLPNKPERQYENFKWGEFLENNGRRKSKDFYLDYEEAKKIVNQLNLKTNTEWRRWCKNKPEKFIRIPSSPDSVYSEWTDWYDWLGNRRLF